MLLQAPFFWPWVNHLYVGLWLAMAQISGLALVAVRQKGGPGQKAAMKLLMTQVIS
jgi:hypothetical protein